MNFLDKLNPSLSPDEVKSVSDYFILSQTRGQIFKGESLTKVEEDQLARTVDGQVAGP